MYPNKNYDYKQVKFDTTADLDEVINEETEKWDIIHSIVPFDIVSGYTNYGFDKPIVLEFYGAGILLFTIYGTYDNEKGTHPVKVIKGDRLTSFNYHPFGSLSGISTSKFRADFIEALENLKIQLSYKPIENINDIDIGQIKDDFSKVLDSLKEGTASMYINPLFEQFLNSAVNLRWLFEYTIERGEDRGGQFWELQILDTTLEDISVADFQYDTKEEAEEDILTAEVHSKFSFEDI